MEVHLSQRTVERLKLRIGELTPRSWGQSLKTCFEGLNEYLRGWFAYFRICTQTGADLFRVFDAHIRRRIRAIIIHQKRRNRFLLRALLARGVSRRAATGTAWSRRGTWHRSNRPGMTRAYPNPWFRARLFSLSDAWLRLHAVQLVSGQLSLFDQALLHGPEQIADLPVPVAESPGAVRIGHPERSHLVEYLAPNSVFNSLPRQRSSPHLRPDDRLVTIDRVLHHASLGVA